MELSVDINFQRRELGQFQRYKQIEVEYYQLSNTPTFNARDTLPANYRYESLDNKTGYQYRFQVCPMGVACFVP